MKLWRWILKLFGVKKKIIMKAEASQPIIEYLKDVKPVDEVEKDRIVAERQKKTLIKTAKKYQKKIYKDLLDRMPPRSMTEKEKEFYAIKPNLQYWVDKGML